MTVDTRDTTDTARHPVMRPIGTDLRVEVIAMLPAWSLVRLAGDTLQRGPFWMRSGRLSPFTSAAEVLRAITA